MTELQNYRFTELQINRQGKSSIAPTFSKRGYNDLNSLYSKEHVKIIETHPREIVFVL